MKYPCVESTAEFVVNGMRIRIWRNEDPHENKLMNAYDNSDIRLLARNHMGRAASMAWLIAAQLRINAVHVQDVETGDGLVIYVEWP
jgi:hypothetical protein